MKIKNSLAVLVLLPMLFVNTGCATAVIAGAAAAGGYLAYEKGYRVRNPVTKANDKTHNN